MPSDKATPNFSIGCFPGECRISPEGSHHCSVLQTLQNKERWSDSSSLCYSSVLTRTLWLAAFHTQMDVTLKRSPRTTGPKLAVCGKLFLVELGSTQFFVLTSFRQWDNKTREGTRKVQGSRSQEVKASFRTLRLFPQRSIGVYVCWCFWSWVWCRTSCHDHTRQNHKTPHNTRWSFVSPRFSN